MSNSNTPVPGWYSNFVHDQLSTKARKQFLAAINAPTTPCEMLTRIILPQLQIHNAAGVLTGSMSVMNDPRRSRAHRTAAAWASMQAKGLPLPFHHQAVFTNALTPADWVHKDAADPFNYRAPSLRVTLGSAVVFTFEFDVSDIKFFEQQLGWLRIDGKKKLHCPIGRLYSALSRYFDFLGLTVVWSGNKSFHIHLSLDPKLMLAVSPLPVGLDPRAGMIAQWKKLRDIVVEHLDPVLNGERVFPDLSLSTPDAFRRLPQGSRIIKNSFFGIPDGTQVPQLVMWEEYRAGRAVRNCGLVFMNGPDMVAAAGQLKAQTNKARTISVARGGSQVYSEAEREYCVAQLKAFYPDTGEPIFDHLVHDGREWQAMFRNTLADIKASSVMREGRVGVLIQGASGEHLKTADKCLPMTLGKSLEAWVSEHRASLRPTLGSVQIDDLFDPVAMRSTKRIEIEIGHQTGESEIEQTFLAGATTRDATRDEMRRFFRSALFNSATSLLADRIWVKAPEGASKTTVLMKMLPKMLTGLTLLRRRQDNAAPPCRAMFAFNDYAAAHNKKAEFDVWMVQIGARYRGVVIPSFSHLYNAVLAKLGVPSTDAITVAKAAARGCDSVWTAVARFQPQVVTEMAQFYAELHASMAGFNPVYFTVHAVAEKWAGRSITRMMCAPGFWDADQTIKDRDSEAMKQTQVAVLVHDEIDQSQVLAIQAAEVVEWTRQLVYSDRDVWKDRGTALDKTYASFEKFAHACLPPTDRSTGKTVTFDTVREIFSMGVEQWSELTLTADGAYPDTDEDEAFYRACVDHGHRWKAKPRFWWRDDIADLVIVLTTEMVPTVAMERADGKMWDIYSLETQLPRDTIDVYPHHLVTAGKMAEAVDDFEGKATRPFHVISDSVKEKLLGKHGKVLSKTTHISARGSNDFAGMDVLQTMGFMAPGEHEKMLALNAYTGRNDCLALSHMDRLNQTAGRNLGFRKDGDVNHVLAINRRLYRWLVETRGWCFTRYDLLVHLSANQREWLFGKR